MKNIRCLFCTFEAETVGALKNHSAQCQAHPLFIKTLWVIRAGVVGQEGAIKDVYADGSFALAEAKKLTTMHWTEIGNHGWSDGTNFVQLEHWNVQR